MDMNFNEVVCPAIDEIGQAGWGNIFNTIYVIDEHESAFFEMHAAS
ncbi:hypothetical protein MTBLM1_40088 [Rhodospirillaceae bacterium LM-1]|nr:hypothetical protein MTBLM1_40088 [Rhodospirillaceae bacterium LM-1]